MAQRLDSRELQLRIVSAAALGSLAIFCLWYHQVGFAGLLAVLSSIMAWEWGRAVRGVEFDLRLLVHGLTICLAILTAILFLTWLPFVILIAGSILLSSLGPKGTRLMSAAGVFYIGVPAVLAVWLRQDDNGGILAILFVLVVVAAHDTFAMATGRLFGGPRLWPSLSPNKTWSGVVGGLVASLVAGYIFALALSGAANSSWIASLGLLIGLAGLIGDLVESAFKRRYDIRHASGVVPGHGGLLDRLDGLLTAITLATIIGFAINPEAPGRALLFFQ